VDAPVPDEVGVLLEALPAVGAAEGPLLCVNPLVQEETGAGLKPLPTLRKTRRASLPCGSFGGRSGWSWRAGALSEALPIFPTLRGPFPSVDHLVVDQVGACPEALPTLQALV
ncbi:hypothetical protein N302_15638, partial [Corvus brachyrhynchos]